ncbi:dual specificity protein phosphatase [Anaeramoeba flamelloides]|uniref:protein-tyrosine-phosphatase n=1 Tax=Anaeramoeba flamelloides TaxID=1746091 RepID=A0AAV7YIE7_9EUKA|nr:dual specificity protein phosphatase [Anaeramoeba flamelloides]
MINEIIPNLYQGSIKIARDKNLLEEYQITHIINMSHHDNEFPNDFEYLHCFHWDSFSDLIIQDFVNIYEFITEALSLDTRVLVHCTEGISRSGAAMVSFIMKRKSMSVEEAVKFVQQKRKKTNPNKSFLWQLKLWEELQYTLDYNTEIGKMIKKMEVVHSAYYALNPFKFFLPNDPELKQIKACIEQLKKDPQILSNENYLKSTKLILNRDERFAELWQRYKKNVSCPTFLDFDFEKDSFVQNVVMEIIKIIEEEK